MNGNSSAGTVNMNMLHVVGDSWAGSKTMIKHGECGEQGRKQKKRRMDRSLLRKNNTCIYMYVSMSLYIYTHIHAYVYAFKIVVYKAGG